MFQISSREQDPQWDHIRRTLALYVAQYTLTVAIMTKLICMIMHGIYTSLLLDQARRVVS